MQKLLIPKSPLFFVLFLTLVVSCKTQTKITEEPQQEIIEERILEPLVITESVNETSEESYELPLYNPSFSQEIDIIHTTLDLRFDWQKQHVLGKASITIKPYFYPTDRAILDAVGFDIHNIQINGKATSHKYDGRYLEINLGRTFKRDEEFELYIDYTAKPNENPIGGSAAITSDKGLFFINPLGDDKNKPMQIWTQGETENNSRWFPTVDKPNESCTQEMILTVKNNFKTLTNGSLLSSTVHGDGTRTDHWKMDLPHAPYLFMLAIGEFAVVTEQWRGIELSYYVDPEYEPYAKEIFDHTPEMLDFFSEITGIEYPWPKLGQVAVQDYVSGAMENTTGIIYGDFVQKTDRELIDNDNDNIVAHEIIHHWFGDMVTCESWANLTLQEGFANYGEYLWREHHNGREYADFHRLNELRGYLGSAANSGIHPLIHFGYEDKELMFDAHSYNKGGLVLHMLRDYLGNDAFNAGMNKYLVDNAYSAVEADELRMAFEDACGEDLNWFFDQWFFDAGHPILEIEYGYDSLAREATLDITQLQDASESPAIFQFPVTVDVYQGDNTVSSYRIWVDQRNQGFRFASSSPPLLVNFDNNKHLLAEIKENKTDEQYTFQYFNTANFQDRYEALKALEGNRQAQAVFEAALDDSFHVLRSIGIRNYTGSNPAIVSKIKTMALEDPHSNVRMTAIDKLSKMDRALDVGFIDEFLKTEQTYPGLAAGLKSLNVISPKKASEVAENYSDMNNPSLTMAIAEIYTSSGEAKHIEFFKNNLTEISLFQTFGFFDQFSKYLQTQELSALMSGASAFKDIGLDASSEPFRRFMATMNLNNLKSHVNALSSTESEEEKQKSLKSSALELGNMIREIKEKEKNPNLLSRYQSF